MTPWIGATAIQYASNGWLGMKCSGSEIICLYGCAKSDAAFPGPCVTKSFPTVPNVDPLDAVVYERRSSTITDRPSDAA